MSLHTLAPRTIAGAKFTSSEWTAGHLKATIDDLAKRYPACRLVIIQPCYRSLVPGGGADQSEGTHDFDGVFDVRIVGMSWTKAQSYLRGQGWAAWHRTPAQGFSDHIHMATIPPGLSGRPTAKQVGEAYARLGLKVGKYIDGGWTTSSPHKITATCQVADYFVHAYGLAKAHTSGGDKSWFPEDIASTIHQPTVVKEKPVATKPPPTPKVVGLFDQIMSLANQILADTTPGTSNHRVADEIRDKARPQSSAKES